MEPIQRQKDVLKGVLILTIGAILTKILSALYRIPFQNMVGDIGFYIYQQVYPFYGMALVLTTNGFPVIISKLYSEKKGSDDKNSADRLIIVSFFFLLVIGLILFISVFLGADYLAGKMNDPNLAILFRVVSIIFIILPFTSVFRGYFQGNGEMMPTAVSQVGEQLIRVMTILLLSAIFMYKGFSPYVVGAGAAFGSITGGITSWIILSYFFRRKLFSQLPILTIIKSMNWKETLSVIKTLMIQGIGICIAGMLLIFIQLADSINLYTLLVSSGIGEVEAKQLKGIYDRGQPLIQLGTILATSMSLSLVPLISNQKVNHNRSLMVGKIQTALKVSTMVGVGGSIGLLCMVRPTNIMLFENAQGSNVLGVICLLILFCSAIITVSSILQGLGASIFPAIIILIGFLTKCILNIPLVMKLGTLGAAVSSVTSMMIILFFLGVKLKRMAKCRLFPRGFLYTIVTASAIMAIILQVYIRLTSSIFDATRIFAAIQSLSAVALGGFIYLIYILRRGSFHEEELALLPFGSKLQALLPKRYRR